MLENDGKKASILRVGGVCSILDCGSAERSEKDADLRAERARAQHRAPLATRLTPHEGEKLRTLMGGQRGQLTPRLQSAITVVRGSEDHLGSIDPHFLWSPW